MPEHDTNAVPRELADLIAERMAAAAEKVPDRKNVSGLTTVLNPLLIRWRRILIIASAATITVASVELFVTLTSFAPVSTIAIVTCVALMVLLFLETVIPTGFQVETEYQIGTSFGREFKFQPSVRSVVALIGILALSTFGLVFGFAGVYSWLYRASVHSFSKALDPISALYFSMVTFATVGYGDIAPATALPRVVVTIQIALSWISIALLFSVTIPWILSNHQRQLDSLMEKDKQRMERTEAMLREAGLGVYGDFGALLEEARRRAATKNDGSK
jgi:hypothetical protein